MQTNKPRILLIEDNPTLVGMLRDWFLLDRYPHQVAGNGEVALSLLADAASEGKLFPQVIILDVHLPVMDGCDFIELARASYPPIPVVVYTAGIDAGQEARLTEAMVERILLKTRAGVRELLAVVDQLGAQAE